MTESRSSSVKMTRIGYLPGSIPSGRCRCPTTSMTGKTSTPGRSGMLEMRSR